jgi:hypothetical protein
MIQWSRSASRPAVTTAAKPAHPRARDDPDPALLDDGFHLQGKGEAHIAARKDALADAQGIVLEKDRFIDFVHQNTAHEIKSGEGKLTDADISQMQDYARMVDRGAKVKLGDGTPTMIERVQYTFTSPAGAKANIDTMRDMLGEQRLRDKLTIEMYKPDGTRVRIKTEAELDAQIWLFE